MTLVGNLQFIPVGIIPKKAIIVRVIAPEVCSSQAIESSIVHQRQCSFLGNVYGLIARKQPLTTGGSGSIPAVAPPPATAGHFETFDRRKRAAESIQGAR